MTKITAAPRKGFIHQMSGSLAGQTYFCNDLDAYEAVLAAAADDLRLSHRADLIAGSVEPDESYEEYLKRHED